MARKPSKRVVLNLAALDQLQFAVAVGLERLGQGIIEESQSRAPRGPDVVTTTASGKKKTRVHLADTGGYVVLNGSRKVGGSASKPKSFDTRRKGIISVVAGYGSPLAHLHERGTAGRVQKKTGRFTGVLPARPFLLPATAHAVDDMARAIGDAIRDAGFSKP